MKYISGMTIVGLVLGLALGLPVKALAKFDCNCHILTKVRSCHFSNFTRSCPQYDEQLQDFPYASRRGDDCMSACSSWFTSKEKEIRQRECIPGYQVAFLRSADWPDGPAGCIGSTCGGVHTSQASSFDSYDCPGSPPPPPTGGGNPTDAATPPRNLIAVINSDGSATLRWSVSGVVQDCFNVVVQGPKNWTTSVSGRQATVPSSFPHGQYHWKVKVGDGGTPGCVTSVVPGLPAVETDYSFGPDFYMGMSPSATPRPNPSSTPSADNSACIYWKAGACNDNCPRPSHCVKCDGIKKYKCLP